jgi:hypothetical protein
VPRCFRIAAFALFPALILAQARATNAAPTTDSPPVAANAPARIYGALKPINGASPLGAASVVLTTPAGGAIAISAPNGTYSSGDLPPGNYRLRVQAPGYEAPEEAAVRLNSGDRLIHDVILTPAPLTVISPVGDGIREGWAGIITALIFLFSVLWTRWYKIAYPSRNFVLARALAVRARLRTEVEPQFDVQPILEMLDRAQQDFLPFNWRWVIRGFLFWGQSNENACWVTVHEAERQLAAYLAPPELVRSNLITMSPQVRELNTAASKALADAMESELKMNPERPQMQRRLVAQATAMIYESRDRHFTALLEWQNKAMWMILAALLIITATAVLGDHIFLFFAGAAGGLLSRLARTLQRQDVPIDYGASWTTLFLSPLLGALSAWYGIALITFLSRPELPFLGRAFDDVQWNTPISTATVAAAVILGFSERWFGSLANAVQTAELKPGSKTEQKESGIKTEEPA